MSVNAVRSAAGESTRLSWNEIRIQFPDAWVVLTDTDWTNDRDFEFGTARVLGHFARRKDASPFIKAAFTAHPSIGCFWTGACRGPGPEVVP